LADFLPNGESPASLEQLLTQLETIKWNVRIQERYSHGQWVAHYLARYLRGGPIGNSRLLPAPDGQVRFKYYNNHQKDESGKGKPDIMTLSADEFLRSLFLHIPPKRLITVRSYGLYAPSKTDTLNHCRALFGQAAFDRHAKLSWQDFTAHQGDDHPECCPVCGQRLIRGEILKPYLRSATRRSQYRSGVPPDAIPLSKAA
jgi:hypothetical protein